MTAFTALLQPAANAQGLLGTFADSRYNTMSYPCLIAGDEGTVREEAAQEMERNAPSDDGTIVVPKWKSRKALKPGGTSTIHTEIVALIVATDLLFAAKLDDLDSVDHVETLLALHLEVINLIVRSEIEECCDSNEIPLFNQVDETRCWRVGVFDSGLLTVTVLGEQLRFGWVIILFRSTSEFIQAVRDQKVEATAVIASVFSERVSQITGFKLLAFRGNIDTLAIYLPATVHYPNRNGNPADDALLVTRSWRSDSMQTRMFWLRNCFVQIVPIIQDQSGTNAAWQVVDGTSTRVFGHGGLRHVG